MMRISSNLSGALFMIAGMASFSINDAIVKKLTEEIGVGQIMFFRGLIVMVIALIIAWRAGVFSHMRAVLEPRVLIRSACELVAAIAYLEALKAMPLANAAAILQCLPLAVTLGAALFMGEPVGWRRWSAIIAGFIGVMIIIKPGPAGFESGALYVVIAMLFATARDLLTKAIRTDVPAIVITLSTSALLTIGGAGLGTIEQDWDLMRWPLVGLLVLAAGFLLIGYQFIVFAVRKADISYVAPFRYTGLLWSTILGMIMFSTYPGVNVLIGGAIVVGAGLYSFYRERQKGIEPLSETTQPGGPQGGGLLARAEEEVLRD